MTAIMQQAVLTVQAHKILAAGILAAGAVKAAETITVLTDRVVTRIFGDTAVRGVQIKNVPTGQTEELELSAVFCAIGTVPNSEPVRGYVGTDEKGYITAGEDCATSEPGIFAAGDIRTKRLRQIITAAADGANAALSAEQYISATDAVK